MWFQNAIETSVRDGCWIVEHNFQIIKICMEWNRGSLQAKHIREFLNKLRTNVATKMPFLMFASSLL